jgi:hypothetical protein
MTVFISHPTNILNKLESVVESVAREKTPLLSLLIRRSEYVRAWTYLNDMADNRINIQGKSLWMWGNIRVSLTKVDYV